MNTLTITRAQLARRLAMSVLAGCAAVAALAQGSGEPLRIGVSLPLTGENAQEGQALLAGAQACLAHAAPRIKGRPVALRALDDGGRPAETARQLQTLAADPQVVAVLGSFGAEANEAALPVLTAAKLPMIGPVTGSEALRATGSRYLLMVRAGLADEATRLVSQLDYQGQDEVALVHTDDALGREGLAAVQLELNRVVMRPIAVRQLSPSGDNAEAVARQIAASKPHAVLVIARGKPAFAFLRQWANQGFRATLSTVSESGAAWMAVDNSASKVLRGLAVSQVWPSPWNGDRGIVRTYQAAMRAAVSATADPRKLFGHASLEGCVNLLVALKALQSTGREPSREALVAALETADLELGDFRLKYRRDERRGSRFTEMTLMTADGLFQR